MQSWTEEGGLRETCAQAELVLVPVNVDRGKLVRDCALLCVTSSVAGQRIGEASALRMQVFDRLQRDDRAKELARKLEVVLPGAVGARGSRGVAVDMLDGFVECADSADVGVFVLGAIAQRVAKAASVQCAGDLTGAESVRSLRSRLRAAFQFLRREVDRLGVRDILHILRGGREEEVKRCRSLLELLAAPSSGQERLGAESEAQNACSSRFLPMLRGDEVQPLAFVTWNVAGNDVAITAPEGFCAQDKFARVAEALQRWQPDVLAVQESPGEGALMGVERSFRLVGAVAAHAGHVQLYVRREAEVTLLPSVPGVPAVFARMKVGACFLTIVVVHLAPHLEGATARREQLASIVEALRAETRVRDDVGAGLAPSGRDGVVLLGDFNVRCDEVVELLEAGDWREAGYQGNSWDPQKNGFYEAPRRRVVSGHSLLPPPAAYDRVWFRGGLWLQAFLVGQCRLVADGKTYFLSDHFPVLALVDVHSVHGSGGSAAAREKRRVDMARLRDAAIGHEREAVTRLERAAFEQDREQQQRASEERLVRSLREQRAAVKAKRVRRVALLKGVYGEEALFGDCLLYTSPSPRDS